MAVAEMPGDPRQPGGVGDLDRKKRLRLCLHRDHAAVLQDQPVAIAEMGRLGEVEEELQPALAAHREAPPVPVVIRKENVVRRNTAPVPRADE
jgi:hypothetical protein